MHPSRKLARLAAALIASTCIAGVSYAAALAPIPDLTSYQLVRLDDGGAVPVSVDEAADALTAYDVIFLGEYHSHPANHVAQMALFRALHARAPNLALSMEQFERDVQPALDDYLAGRIGEEALRSRGRAWRNYPDSYRPLVEFAKENELPVIAANAAAAVVRCVGQEGPEVLTRLKPEARAWAAAELHLDGGPYRDKFIRFLTEDGMHGPDNPPLDAEGRPTEATLRSFASQATRDDTMAESVFLHLRTHPGRKIVHTTGAFHVAGFLGTAERLKLRAPELKIAVIAPIEIATPNAPALGADDAGVGTYGVLLRTLPPMYVTDAEKQAATESFRTMIRGRTSCALTENTSAP